MKTFHDDSLTKEQNERQREQREQSARKTATRMLRIGSQSWKPLPFDYYEAYGGRYQVPESDHLVDGVKYPEPKNGDTVILPTSNSRVINRRKNDWMPKTSVPFNHDFHEEYSGRDALKLFAPTNVTSLSLIHI